MLTRKGQLVVVRAGVEDLAEQLLAGMHWTSALETARPRARKSIADGASNPFAPAAK